MVLIATQVKRRRGTTAENDAFTGAEGEITVDTEKHQLRVHDGETQGGFVIGSGGSGRNIGDIFYTKRTDTGLAGAVECNGGTYNAEDYTGAGSIGELLAGGKLDYISLSAYATAISTKGWCDKIGWDGTGTTAFRVPTLTPHIIQKNNIPVVGNGKQVGFTLDGTTTLGGKISTYPGVGITTFLSQESGGNILPSTAGSERNVYGDSGKDFGITTDGTKSGIIADTTDTAQLRVMFQLFNGTTDEAVATVGGVLADVSNLKDMSNITADGKEVIAHQAMPSDRYVDLTLGGQGSAYIAPADGYFIYKGSGTASGAYLVMSNEKLRMAVNPLTLGSGGGVQDYLPVKKGDTMNIWYANLTTNYFRFIYAEGAQ